MGGGGQFRGSVQIPKKDLVVKTIYPFVKEQAFSKCFVQEGQSVPSGKGDKTKKRQATNFVLKNALLTLFSVKNQTQFPQKQLGGLDVETFHSWPNGHTQSPRFVPQATQACNFHLEVVHATQNRIF